MSIVCRFTPPRGFVFMFALFLSVGVYIATYIPLRPCSCNYVIGMSMCLILSVSLSCLTCEITASLSSYAGVGQQIGNPSDALDLLNCITRLIHMKYAWILALFVQSATSFYFFNFHAHTTPLYSWMRLVTDLLFATSLVRSEFANILYTEYSLSCLDPWYILHLLHNVPSFQMFLPFSLDTWLNMWMME